MDVKKQGYSLGPLVDEQKRNTPTRQNIIGNKDGTLIHCNMDEPHVK